jgi:hypothetical protein
MRARLALCLALAACGADFDDVTNVKDLRVLAVVADPPEILVDDVAALPDAFPAITLRPLVVDPAGPRPLVVRAVACANREQASDRGRDRGPGGTRDTIATDPCPVAASVSLDVVAAEPAALEPRVELRFAPTRAFVESAFAADPFSRGPLSLRATPLTIEVTVATADESVIARKRVLVSQRPVPDQRPNENPIVAGLNVRATRDGAEVLIDPTSPQSTLPPRGRLFVDPVPAPAEPYQTFELGQPSPVAARETLRYAFYARYGSFAPAQTTNEPPRVITEPTFSIQSQYRAPAVAPPDGLDPIWVVVRDERAGQSFIRAAVRVSGP